MSDPDALREFEAGVDALRRDGARKALDHFNKALELDRSNPIYLSYLGLALAAGEQKWDEAEQICLSAVRLRRTQPELYLNLAQVYRMAGKKEDALLTLQTALETTKQDPRIVAALHKHGYRRPPVLSFLERTHFLNQQLGRLRHRVLGSLGRDA